MIGKKTVRELRADLLEQCATAGLEPAEWFNEQIRKLEGGRSPDPREIETLELIRDGLQAKLPATKPARRRARTPSSK